MRGKSNATHSAVMIFSERRRKATADVVAALAKPFVNLPRVSTIRAGSFDLAYSTSCWIDVGGFAIEAGERSRVREREVEGRLVSDGQQVGYMLFREYSVAPFTEDDELWMACDCHSSSASKLAESLLSGWPASVADYGLIVEFARLWILPGHARSSAWAAPVSELFVRRWTRRGPAQCAVLLLKPFPLEHEAVAHIQPKAQASRLSRRTAAMRRLYASQLGVQPLRGGEWMWRTFNDRAPSPATRARRWLRQG